MINYQKETLIFNSNIPFNLNGLSALVKSKIDKIVRVNPTTKQSYQVWAPNSGVVQFTALTCGGIYNIESNTLGYNISNDLIEYDINLCSGNIPLTGVTSVNTRTGAVVLDKTDVNLGSVDNTSDLDKPISNLMQNALNNKSNINHIHDIDDISNLQTELSSKQPVGNYATLVNGTIPASQLPAYVDEILEFTNKNLFPNPGSSNKIYVDTSNNKVYRWGGTTYVELVASPGSTDAVPEGSINLYYTNERASAASPIQSINGKVGTVILDKSDIGLNNVNNTSDANKPISDAAQAAINAKAPINNPSFTGTVNGITKSMVGLGNVDNTSDLTKPVSAAQAAANLAVQEYSVSRNHHTGTQAISTIDNLQSILDNKSNINHTHTVDNLPYSVSYPVKAVHVGGMLSFNNFAFTASPTYFWNGSTGDLRTLGTIQYPDTSIAVSVQQSVDKYLIDFPGRTLTYASLEIALIDSNNCIVGWGTTSTSNVAGTTNGTAGTSMTISLFSFPSNIPNSWILGGNASPSTPAGLLYPYISYKQVSSKYLYNTDNVPEGDTNLYFTNTRASAASPVQSVSGKTGIVTLNKDDVGLNNVDNTSDINKPISSAVQSALNLKANLTDINAGTILSSNIPQSGRLTLSSNTAVPGVWITGATTLYYARYNGNLIGLFDTVSNSWKSYTFNQISLSLAGLPANTNFDIYIYNNNGTLTLEPIAWLNNTARASQTGLLSGVLVLGSNNNKRYLGTIRTTNTAGQCEDSGNRRFVSNYYNRVQKNLYAVAVANHTYSGSTWRAWNNNTTVGSTRVEFVSNVIEDDISFSVTGQVKNGYLSVGVNSANHTLPAYFVTSSSWSSATVNYYQSTTFGYNYLQAIQTIVPGFTAEFTNVYLNGMLFM